MVLEAVSANSEWRASADDERCLVFAAALLHDIGKPPCTRMETGRITSRGHSRRGAQMARAILWDAGAPPLFREKVAALVRYHQVPFFLAEHTDAERLVARLSQLSRCDHAVQVAEAATLGRVSADQNRLLENVASFREYCRERRCLDGPASFPSDHARFRYFRGDTNDLSYQPYDDTRLEVVLMSGLPGAGK